MTKLVVTAAVLALSVTACKKTSENTYEVQQPVVGTKTDTIHTPDIDVTMDSTKVTVPNVDIHKDTATVKVPKVRVQ
jgi:hypothetical protein